MDIMYDTVDFGVTMFGLTALQMPALVSCAPKDSILSSFQVLGFPFNMSKLFMKSHVAFSPGNVIAGRYYTMFTSLYYHPESDYLMRNMGLLATCGKVVHTEVGRWHFLSILTGGAFVGNLSMWVHYLMQRSNFKNGVLDLHQLPTLAKTDILKEYKDQCLEVSFDVLNSWITSYGASAGVNAVLAFGACCATERLIRLLRQHREERSEVDLFANMFHVVFTLRLFSNDVIEVIKTFSVDYGLFDQLTTKTRVVGHATHVGGALFGVMYYLIYKHYKRR